MALKLSLSTSGLLDPSRLQAWTNETQAKIRGAVKTGMDAGGKAIAVTVRDQVKAKFKVKNRGFLNSWKHKIYDRKPERLPDLLIGSKLYFSGVLDKGGTIRGKEWLWVPLPGFPRLSRKAIKALMSTKTTFVKPRRDGGLTVFQRVGGGAGGRAVVGGAVNRVAGGRYKKGAAVPIAILVKSVTLKKSLGLERIVKTSLPSLAKQIEQELRRV